MNKFEKFFIIIIVLLLVISIPIVFIIELLNTDLKEILFVIIGLLVLCIFIYIINFLHELYLKEGKFYKFIKKLIVYMINILKCIGILSKYLLLYYVHNKTPAIAKNINYLIILSTIFDILFIYNYFKTLSKL